MGGVEKWSWQKSLACGLDVNGTRVFNDML